MADQDRYASLRRVLDLAVEQAAEGKGKERHAGKGLAFDEQPMMQICKHLGGPQFALGQAIKKAVESTRLKTPAAKRELLGAINYLAGAYLWLEMGE